MIPLDDLGKLEASLRVHQPMKINAKRGRMK